MSLILEALRKSEAERRRGQAPDVSVELAPPPPARTGLARWLWPVLALLALLAALPLAAIWWATRTPAVPTASPVAAPPAATGAQVAPAPAVVPRRPQPAPESAAAPPPSPPSPPSPTPSPPPTPALPPLPTPAPPAPATVDAAAATSMPGVKLSMHLWNDDPARRFVVLNGQRMMEGERSGDLLLVEILRDGVLVERAGRRARIELP